MHGGNRAFGRTILALAVLTVALHVLGARGPASSDALWGVHHFAFFPSYVLLLAIFALALVLILSRSDHAPIPAALESMAVRSQVARRCGFLWLAAISLFAGGLFWFARARHTLLGDGNVIVAGLPQAPPFHVREPLSACIDYLLFHGLHRFAPAGMPPYDLAQRAVALGSVIAGVLFVPCARGLARELMALRPCVAPRPPATWLLAGILMSQGYVQLFFGYVENYTFLLLAIGAYLWLALRFLAGRSPFILPACAALLAFGLHLSAAVLLPSVLCLACIGLWTPHRRRAVLRDLVLGGVVLVLLALLLAWLGHGYHLFNGFLQVVRDEILLGGRNRISYLFTRAHLRDFPQEQLLVGPLGLALFLPALIVVATRRPGRISSSSIFLMLVGLSELAVAWIAGDGNLGYARNWDILAPAGLVFTMAGLGLFVIDGAAERGLKPALVWALAASLLHTAPWIAVNASETRGLARMKTLPLGGGRTEMVVGNWYLRRGRLADARWWLEHSFEANSRNVGTCYLLGRVYSLQQETERALRVLDWGASLRPDDPEFERRIVEALVAAGRHPETLAHFQKLLQLPAASPEDWTRYGDVLQALGQPEQATAAREKALALCEAAHQRDPGDYTVNLRLGEILEKLERPERALQFYTRASQLQPDSTAAQLGSGRLLLRLGQRDRARDVLEKILRSHPDDPRAQQIEDLLRETKAPSQ